MSVKTTKYLHPSHF